MKHTKTTAITTTTKNATATKKTATVKTNENKFDTVLSMNDIITLAHSHKVCFFATENKSTQYRIFNGKSSLNIKKTMYVLYCTDIDFDNFENAKLENVTCTRDGNIVDGVRKHKVTIKPCAIENVIKVLALNDKNRMQ